MANAFFSYDEFNFGGVEDKLSSSDRSFVYTKGDNIGKQIHSNAREDWGESETFDSLRSDFVFYPNSLAEGFIFSKNQYHHQQPPQLHHHHHHHHLQQQQQSISDYGLLDDFRFDVVSPPIQTALEEITDFGEIPTEIQDYGEFKKEKPCPTSFASLELLNNYGSGFKRLNGENKTEPSNDKKCTKVAERELSTEEVMRVAGARFIQSSFQSFDALSSLSHPFNVSFSNLSDEEIKDVELAECLLASAEKVGYQQFDRARKLLNLCDQLSSQTGNPVQRVVCYFSEALREKIDRETGRITSKGMGKKLSYDLEKAMMTPNLITLACETEMPFSQVGKFASIQAIVENVTDAKKVHIIDLRIGNGSQWTALMQALVARHECPIELLKITAIGTTLRPAIEDTGKKLVDFAQTMNLPFSFKIVMVSDMADLNTDLFELDVDEAVAVYSAFSLRTMIRQPNQLESLMRVIRNIYPCVMVVTEVEANHNSPVFVDRFTEALFFFSAFFDCLESCMKTNPNRMNVESLYFSQGIKNIIATEGEERRVRNVKIDVWRAFFTRYGLVETELSMSSLYQASLVLKNFDCGHYCTLDMNGKCLIIGWKGAPLQSLSVWKFL